MSKQQVRSTVVRWVLFAYIDSVSYGQNLPYLRLVTWCLHQDNAPAQIAQLAKDLLNNSVLVLVYISIRTSFIQSRFCSICFWTIYFHQRALRPSFYERWKVTNRLGSNLCRSINWKGRRHFNTWFNRMGKGIELHVKYFEKV